MPARTAPNHVLKALKDFDADLSVVWNDRLKGWEFAWRGTPQGSILHHTDGVKVMELDSTETVALARRGQLNIELWRKQHAAAEAAVDEARQEARNRRVAELADEAGSIHQVAFNPRTYSSSRSSVHA